MLDVKCNAEIKSLNVRTEAHGDEYVPAVDVKMLLIGVPVGRISTLCPDMEAHFYDGDQVAVGEVNPLTVGHKVENVRVRIADHGIEGADIKKGAKIKLLPNRVADVELSIQTVHRNQLALHVMDLLRQEVEVRITERQAEMELVQ